MMVHTISNPSDNSTRERIFDTKTGLLYEMTRNEHNILVIRSASNRDGLIAYQDDEAVAFWKRLSSWLGAG